MKRSILPRALIVMAVAVALCAIPQGALAQRGGGHAGFGGFHGGSFGGFHGGNFGGFHGAGFRGGAFGGSRGFRGPGFGGFRGGFGWRGGYWGYPRFGWGWNFGFGFAPYWGWNYPYYYSPWWGPYAYSSPYSYSDPDRDPYYDRDSPNYDRDSRRSGCDYRYTDHCPHDGQNGPPPQNRKPDGQAPGPKPSSSPVAQKAPDYRAASQDYRTGSHALPVPAKFGTVSYTFAEFKTLEPSSEMRPAVRNVVESLRAMPPDVQKQQLSSGRYAGLSPEEKQLLLTLLESHGQQ